MTRVTLSLSLSLSLSLYIYIYIYIERFFGGFRDVGEGGSVRVLRLAGGGLILGCLNFDAK